MEDVFMKRFFALGTLLAALALALTAGRAGAQPPKSDKVVKVAAKADRPDDGGNQTVTVTLDVDKPYHVYANPVENDGLKSVQTTVRFTTKLEGQPKVEYPEGKLIKDETVGNYRTYEGKVTIRAKVKRARGDTAPLNLEVKVQACDEKACLLPATVKATAE
jgi:thiol:disulfide interchange protein